MPRLPRKRKRRTREIEPDEILIDSSNLPAFDRDQFEGRIEQPLSRRSLALAGALAVVVMLLYGSRAWDLQFVHGTAYAKQAAENKLFEQTVMADRGTIVDRNGVELASNTRASVDDDFSQRVYTTLRGLAHVVGYAKPPAKDSSGVYFRSAYEGVDGAEEMFNTELTGQNGITLSETDARGDVVSQSVKQDPTPGDKITLSVDANLTQGLYDAISSRAQASGFQGGAGVIINVQTGEILAMTSYPEYSMQAMSSGDQSAISSYNTDKGLPFLNRAINGLYAPGSIVKPFVGVAALAENVISPDKQILSTGSISVPNPYDPKHPSIFKDWRPQGLVALRDAIAVSSDVYFYEVGGGFQDQPGLGIDRLDSYLRLFGFGEPTGLPGVSEPTGTIPTPAWKATTFPNDPTWHLGDTYHTAIGQYGVQVTPLQAVRAVASLANGGKLLTPTLIASSTPKFTQLNLPQNDLEIVREGMRQGVVSGISTGVNFPYIQIAAKTGTAQVGVNNEFENSWMVGFFPYDHPTYAYAIVLERGPSGVLLGATAAAAAFFQWMHENTPQYFDDTPPVD